MRTLIPKISRVVEIGTLLADHAKTLASRCFHHHPAANVGNAAGTKIFQTGHFCFDIVGFEIQVDTAGVINLLYLDPWGSRRMRR